VRRALAALVLACLTALSPVLGQSGAAETPAKVAATPPGTVTAPAADPNAAAATEAATAIRRIISEEEDVLSGKRFTYDPAGRRDPFRSLIEKVDLQQQGPRPTGIAGMMISEVDLVGIVDDPEGDLAFFNGSDNRGYFLRVGEKLYDGQIVRIDPKGGRVVFRQEVNDPRLIKPFREVVKELNTVEEGIP
jgi:type IV pilus assembly protein PilP